MPNTLLFTLAYILIFYHVVLVFRLMRADHAIGLSMSIGYTIVTHLAVVALVVLLAFARHQIPFFGIIRYFIPGLAPFEVSWLFRVEPKDRVPTVKEAEKSKIAESTIQTATADDHQEWLNYLAKRDPRKVKRGLTIKDEYALWLDNRAKSR